MSDELTPITRKETFLAKAGGQNVVTPTPITREETFLQAIIDNGGGGGGGTGGGVLVVGYTYDNGTYTLDKTAQEIYDADFAIMQDIYQSGPVSAKTNWGIVVGVERSPIQIDVHMAAFNEGTGYTLDHIVFNATSATDYPTYTE